VLYTGILIVYMVLITYTMYIDCVYGSYIHVCWLCIWVLYTYMFMLHLGALYMYIDCVFVC